MGTWGAGNFESDGALDYVNEVADEIAARIEEILDDGDRSALDEEGEAVLMPSVAMLSVLHEHCGGAPPKPDVVRRWKKVYLAIFDDQIDDLEPKETYKQERRVVIERTFTELEGQAVAFWQQG
jgi:hypothetical protein